MKYTVDGYAPDWLKKIVEGITYKPGWSLHISNRSSLYTSTSSSYSFGVNDPYMCSISAQCTVEDVVTRSPIMLHGPGVTIYREYSEEKVVVEMIFRSIRALENHEIEEQFHYNGIRIFDPHREHAEKDKLFELAALNLPKEMRQ